MKLSELVSNATAIPATLIRSTVRQIGGWEEFKSRAVDVTNHGAAGGFGGFTYYRDTVAFTARNRAAILQMADAMADDFGMPGGAVELIAGFQCMKDYSVTECAEGLFNARSEHRQTVYNALAWFALEEVSRAYADAVYNRSL